MTDGPSKQLDSNESLTDDELCALALSADPDTTVDEHAVSVWDVIGPGTQQRLPQWYMPAPTGNTRAIAGWRRHVIRFNVALIIASFVTINAYGLCNTYGQLHF